VKLGPRRHPQLQLWWGGSSQSTCDLGGGSGSICFTNNCFYTLNKGSFSLQVWRGVTAGRQVPPTCTAVGEAPPRVQSLTLASFGDAGELPGGARGSSLSLGGSACLCPVSQSSAASELPREGAGTQLHRGDPAVSITPLVWATLVLVLGSQQGPRSCPALSPAASCGGVKCRRLWGGGQL